MTLEDKLLLSADTTGRIVIPEGSADFIGIVFQRLRKMETLGYVRANRSSGYRVYQITEKGLLHRDHHLAPQLARAI